MEETTLNLLGVNVKGNTKTSILEKIKKYISSPNGFFHIVSINPENIIVARRNQEFKRVIETAHITHVDGIGIVLAGRILGHSFGERVAGVDLMKELLLLAQKMRLQVLFIGGEPNLANKLAECYSYELPEAKFYGISGIKNIRKPERNEEEKIFSIVASLRPRLIFVSFGSPYQELWLYRHRDKLKGAVCMGVGGAFNYLSGKVFRAPKFIRRFGFEWLYRLISQPWRLVRQTRLILFLYLIIKEKIFGK